MTTATWSIYFTEQFKADLDRASGKQVAQWLKKIDTLLRDPYAKIPNAKALRGHSKHFRLRIGDFRLIYRVLDDLNRVLLLRAADRKNTYKGRLPTNTGGMPIGTIFHRPDETQQSIQPVDDLSSDLHGDSHDEPEVETPGELISADELYLIGIPQGQIEPLLEVTSLEELAALDIPEGTKSRIEDYLTQPDQTHIGRIYLLDESQDLPAIASQPLSEFLLALDNQQKEVVEKPLDGGPYLIRGGPGTGKTLIALYRLKAIYDRRLAESLFDTQTPYVLFVTYTRMLSATGKTMLERVIPPPHKVRIVSWHLDKTVAGLATRIEQHRCSVLNSRQSRGLLEAQIRKLRKRLEGEEMENLTSLLSGHGSAFICDEIESVIYGQGLENPGDYFNLKRTGRKTPLRVRQRRAIWQLYEAFDHALTTANQTTFERRRLHLLRAIDSGEYTPRTANALFVDEIQDLSPTSIRLLLKLAGNPRFVTFLGDSGQSIYRSSSPWRDISSELRFHRGNSFSLNRTYRCTRQLEQALLPLRLDPDATEDQTPPPQAVFDGPKPHWCKAALQNHLLNIGNIVQQLTLERDIHPGQIAVIVPYNGQISEAVNALKDRRLPASAMDRSVGLNLEQKAVHVLNVHSSKGLEFPFVILPFVSDGNYPSGGALRDCRDDGEREEAIEQQRRLLYVGLSRAAHELWMITDANRPSRYLDVLNSEHWQVEI